MRKSLKVWLKGLATAGISAAGTAIGAATIAPTVFNLSRSGIEHTASLILFPMLHAVGAKLSESPLPPDEGEDTPKS